jgi:hypothetical protein
MSGAPREIAANVLAESPVYIAAGVISYFVNTYVTLRLGHESLTTFIVIGLGLGGTWCGQFPWTKKWVWFCAIVFFVAVAAYSLMLKNPDPNDLLLLAEKFSLGLTFSLSSGWHALLV